MNGRVTVIIPARNEAESLGAVLPRLGECLPGARILVVDDGSTDDTAAVARAEGADVVSHPYTKGNGAAVKTGVRNAETEWLLLMDADSQHAPEDAPRLLARLEAGYDMVVGTRGWSGQANVGRGLANGLYSRLASWVVGQPIPDLTSGFRAVRRERFGRFLHLFPNGFSYPSTATMAFFRAGYSVAFEPVVGHRRRGNPSHIRPFADGVRFLLIIFRIGTLYSPLKLFVPVSAAFLALGLGHYGYTFVTEHRFTNMSALLLATSVVVFLIGLVSEQITSLLYRDEEP